MVRTRNAFGRSPVHVACQEGHLHVARWLSGVGIAADDVRTQDVFGRTALYIAALKGHLDVAAWLLLLGAAPDAPTLKRDVPSPRVRESLAVRVTSALAAHAAFTGTFLVAAHLAPRTTEESVMGHPSRPQEPSEGGALSLLRGHEATLLVAVADYAGVPRGGRLRCARSAMRALETLRRETTTAPDRVA